MATFSSQHIKKTLSINADPPVPVVFTQHKVKIWDILLHTVHISLLHITNVTFFRGDS